MRPTNRKTTRVVRDAVETCLTSDLDETAKVVWVWLYLCRGGGMGSKSLAKTLQILPEVVEEAIEVLRERGVCRRANGMWTAVPFPVTEDPLSAPEDDRGGAYRGHARAMLAHYDEARIAAGHGPVMDQRSALTCFERLAPFLEQVGAKFDRYLEFGIEKTSRMRDRIGFPPPSLLAGPWLRDAWANGIDGHTRAPEGAQSAHAGASYRQPVGLRTQLVAAGFERARGFGKAELRRILEWAENMIAVPEHFPDPDPDYAPEIRWVYQRLKENEDA